MLRRSRRASVARWECEVHGCRAAGAHGGFAAIGRPSDFTTRGRVRESPAESEGADKGVKSLGGSVEGRHGEIS